MQSIVNVGIQGHRQDSMGSMHGLMDTLR